ncbi:MAG: class I SAM-dependent methyltransferase [Candidatus Woesearchaeota archaeon]
MLGLKVALKNAEKWKKYLVVNNLIDKKHYYSKDKEYIYFPILQKFIIINAKEISFVEKEFSESISSGTLKENLSKTLSKEEFAFVKTAHDIIGSIAIIEIPKDLELREKLIAETLLKANSQIKTVLKKADIHSGVFRTQKMTYLAGIDTKETIYKENGVRIKLDVESVYFSIRLGNERKRIMKQIKSGEEILIMFSGCAPYPVVLAKNTSAKHITGIEINPDGHKYGLENIKLNKIKNVDLICGDVHKVIPELRNKNPKLTYNRIAMPLPKTADEFLDDALIVSKKGTIIHFYDFLPEAEFDDAIKKIDEACKKRKLKHKIIEIAKCGQHAPHIYRICVDFKIL